MRRAAADQQHLDTVESLRLTRESLAFTRDEFNATHRPELLIREVTWEMRVQMLGAAAALRDWSTRWANGQNYRLSARHSHAGWHV